MQRREFLHGVCATPAALMFSGVAASKATPPTFDPVLIESVPKDVDFDTESMYYEWIVYCRVQKGHHFEQWCEDLIALVRECPDRTARVQKFIAVINCAGERINYCCSISLSML